MNEELKFAQKISHALDHGNDDLDPKLASRLHAARMAALDHQRQPVAVFSLAGIGHLTADFFRSSFVPAILAFALIIGAAGTLYVDDLMQADENEELDSALLSDELPINAYLDDGFQIWVNASSPSSD
ncbi:MAG: DUF3619 family protein [Rhodocyclaceae bacterium]|nr:DUF3619 family protein [Rhodocyclaceae bacterium]